ncbi:hypothetical protein BCR34DRAFT_554346 [Clohesyomyces aquaticus]|uniref:Uncharacterized protein n=1 Tax=Clohesyomyces aquaticus TaxID=1231657 RepID=A0A1Y2A6S7_9PLEO|nr:hypothetical protein BCR34DRAFT_554346 [Clohesyomyces aquaticus]
MAEAPKKTKHSKLDAVPINLGLEQLYPPDEPMKPSTKFAFEIIAIPGLGANPEWTWKKDKVHWLKDGNMLARKVPNARISVFQYQSQWFGRGAVDQKLDNVANQLLYALERSRGSESKVPIIFVAHCLGGIILEKAILTARLRQNDFPSVFPWIAGCVFLGTPFRGTETQAKAEILAKFAETINLGASSSLLKLLEKDSDTLRRLRNDFVKLSAEAHIRLFCFFESQKSNLASQLPLMKGTSFQKMELIVDEESATFDGSENLSLVSDHFQLNKYTGPKDGNFVAVSDEIKVTAQKAPGILKSRQNALRQMLVDDKTYHALVAALGKGFSDLDATMCGSYRGPKAAQPSWVLDVENYKTWKDNPDNPLLWTHGKAGTGQASIASSIIEDLNKTRQQGTIVTSFFCDQGDENRRSLRGLLKIIIRQVIDVSQDMASHLLTDSKKGKKTGTQDLDLDSLSKVSTLWDALHSMARDLPAGFLYVVVFGIEQLSKESLSEWLELIRSIPTGDDRSEEAPVKILLLSRSGRPDIEKALKPRFLQINLDDSENAERVSDALRADISARVNELALPAPLAYFVKRHIHSRAEDNSIYVSLVIQELKNVQGTNMTAAEIRALLESFPYGLTEMFEVSLIFLLSL